MRGLGLGAEHPYPETIGHPRDNPEGEARVKMFWAVAGLGGLALIWAIMRLRR